MFLADVALAGPGDCLEQLVPNPELKQPVRHQDVALAAAVVLAHADVLPVDADDAVARDTSRNPLLTVALRASHELPTLVLAVEPAHRRHIAQRLVRPLRVVVAHPLIESFLCRLQIPEHLTGVELVAEVV